MPRYLLDTNICIFIAKRKPREVLDRFETLDAGDVAISLVTYGELVYGAMRSTLQPETMATITRLAEAIPVLPMTVDTATHYGAIRAFLAAAGTKIGNDDLWTAAHARAAGLTLVTSDETGFRHVPDLRVENWVVPK